MCLCDEHVQRAGVAGFVVVVVDVDVAVVAVAVALVVRG